MIRIQYIQEGINTYTTPSLQEALTLIQYLLQYTDNLGENCNRP